MKEFIQCGIQRYECAGIAVKHNFDTGGYVGALLERNDGARTAHGPVLYDIYLSRTRQEVSPDLVDMGECNLSRLPRIHDLARNLEGHDSRVLPRRVMIVRSGEKPRRVRIYASRE